MTPAGTAPSLASFISQTRLEARDALRYAMIVADALRQVHDRGQVHGALTPQVVVVSENEVRLLPAETPAGTITPYTAPEVAAGKPADARSDIFSFGAIVYEMMTGRPAFSGSGSEALAEALATAVPAPSGSAALDRVLTGCLAKAPASRWQHLRNAQLELKLLAAAMRRASQESSLEASRKELRNLESLVVTRLDEHEAAIGRLHEGLAQVPQELRVQFEDQLVAAAERAASADDAITERLARIEQSVTERLTGVEQGLQTLRERVAAVETTVHENLREVERSLREQLAVMAADAAKPAIDWVVAAEQTLGGAAERMAGLERALEADRGRAAASETSVNGSLRHIEQSIKDLAAAVESTRVATVQTDGLLERVVEALESLQSTVL